MQEAATESVFALAPRPFLCVKAHALYNDDDDDEEEEAEEADEGEGEKSKAIHRAPEEEGASVIDLIIKSDSWNRRGAAEWEPARRAEAEADADVFVALCSLLRVRNGPARVSTSHSRPERASERARKTA